MLKRKSYSAAWQPLPHLLAGIDEHIRLSMSAPIQRYLLSTGYRASSCQCCNAGPLYSRKEMENNRQKKCMIFICDSFSQLGAGDQTLGWMKADWGWTQPWIYPIGLFLTAENYQYGILWKYSSIRKKRHWENKIESEAQIPEALYGPKTPVWGVWERGAETSECKDAYCSVYWWSSRISRKRKQRGENLLLTLLLQILSFKAVLQNSVVCDRQENDVQYMVSQEKAVSATDCCAHPQEVNEELHGFCFKWSWTVIPGDLRADIMQWIHISHLRIETCLRWARKCIYRPGMNTQLKAYIKAHSANCAKNTVIDKKRLMEFQPRPRKRSE